MLLNIDCALVEYTSGVGLAAYGITFSHIGCIVAGIGETILSAIACRKYANIFIKKENYKISNHI